jgi:hypothetical protein
MAQQDYPSNFHAGRDGLCPGCSDSNTGLCDLCFLIAKGNEMVQCLKIMMKNKPIESLFELVAQTEANKVIVNHPKGKEMIKKLKELAEEYSQLELKTRGV